MCIYVYGGILLTFQYTIISIIHNVYCIGARNMERLPIFGAKIYKPVLPQPNCLKISIKFPVNFIF